MRYGVQIYTNERGAGGLGWVLCMYDGSAARLFLDWSRAQSYADWLENATLAPARVIVVSDDVEGVIDVSGGDYDA